MEDEEFPFVSVYNASLLESVFGVQDIEDLLSDGSLSKTEQKEEVDFFQFDNIVDGEWFEENAVQIEEPRKRYRLDESVKTRYRLDESVKTEPQNTGEKTFLSIFLEKFPDWDAQKAKEILNQVPSAAEVKKFEDFCEFLFPDLNCKDCDDDLCARCMTRHTPFPSDELRRDNLARYGRGEAAEIAKMEQALQKNYPTFRPRYRPRRRPPPVEVNGMYKSKAKKV
ncbi:uncharacterized protein LY89DRAFT_415637 [Mollisia scopiformis]|uniref:Uncharacterized protein n=1 Tax=Mollisia scopiformis TaxID=149040 RepID=A0A132B1G0_MOLSC|nr:uncharacterized protein LY89DRAFT_415637 [Mollisia scopiformis]KUJ06216.1 hypothetical protein LY89DRAFT_415637 [Mollisia scopiformis]